MENTILTKLSYCAGIVDGEGHISIVMGGGRKGTVNKYHYLTLRVGNTHRELIEKLHMEFNCGTINFKKTPLGKPFYMWICSSNEAYSVINLIFPFLIVKKKQAELAIVFHNNKKNINGKKLSDSELLWREDIRKQINKLNHVGF